MSRVKLIVVGRFISRGRVDSASDIHIYNIYIYLYNRLPYLNQPIPIQSKIRLIHVDSAFDSYLRVHQNRDVYMR